MRGQEAKMRYLVAAILILAVAACASVRQKNTDAWVGQPVAALDKQPVFLTMQRVSTRAADGTEIRNYVNGANVGRCAGSGTGMVFSGGDVPMATYSAFSNCMSRFAACNNIFYIKDGVVERYVPVGSGGMRCYTDARAKPGYSGPTNFR